MIYRSAMLVYLLLALCCSVFAVNVDNQLLNAVRTIQAHVRDVQGEGGDLCASNNCCKLSSGNCNLSSFPKDQTTLVYPGGKTRCIYSTSTDFAFQVIPGATDKVLLYFQGGGACWDEASTKANFCTSDASPNKLQGVFDHSNPSNPYKDYTVVQVLYCSGDLHGGDVTRSYTDSKGQPVVQVGATNTQSVFSWIQGQQSNGQLASTLTDLVVMGCSAGSIGTQLWAQKALDTFSWTHAAVIPDSYAGVFPDGTQGPLIAGFNICPILDASLQASCEAGTLTLQDVTSKAISTINSKYAHVPYSFIQSKIDDVQIAFYVAVGALTPDAKAAITPEEFYAEVNKIFEGYNPSKNFVNYMVAGTKHCFTPTDVVYTADTTGRKLQGEQSMISWLAGQPLHGNDIATQCNGDNVSQANWSGYNYCDAALAGKTFA